MVRALLLVCAWSSFALARNEDLAFLDAVKRQDLDALDAMTEVPFTWNHPAFRTTECEKRFPDATVSTDRAAASICLAFLHVGDGYIVERRDTVMGNECWSELQLGDYDVTLVLDLATPRPWKVKGLAMRKHVGPPGPRRAIGAFCARR